MRALHVRVSGLKDRDNMDEEVKELMFMMGVDEPTHESMVSRQEKWRHRRYFKGKSTYFTLPLY